MLLTLNMQVMPQPSARRRLTYDPGVHTAHSLDWSIHDNSIPNLVQWKGANKRYQHHGRPKRNREDQQDRCLIMHMQYWFSMGLISPGPVTVRVVCSFSCLLSPCTFGFADITNSTSVTSRLCIDPLPLPLSTTVTSRLCLDPLPLPLSTTVTSRLCVDPLPLPLSTTITSRLCLDPLPLPLSTTVTSRLCLDPLPLPLSTSVTSRLCLDPLPLPLSTTVTSRLCLDPPPLPLSTTVTSRLCLDPPPSPFPPLSLHVYV